MVRLHFLLGSIGNPYSNSCWLCSHQLEFVVHNIQLLILVPASINDCHTIVFCVNDVANDVNFIFATLEPSDDNFHHFV